MPLPNQGLSQHAVNASSLIIQPIPKYVFDQLNYPHQEEMEAGVFLERHPCFSKVTITPQGEYLLSCAVSAEKVITAIANLENPEQNIKDRAVETLQSEFMKLIDYFLNSSVPLPLSFTYLNIILLEEKLMQITKKIFDQLEGENIKEGGEGVDKTTLNLKLVPRMQEFAAIKRVQNELLSRQARLKNAHKQEEIDESGRAEAVRRMYS
jgi:hypothetical protein